MMLAAVVIWLVFAFVFWCMMAGAARGDVQVESALDRTKSAAGDRRTILVETPTDSESLSHAA